MKNNTKTKKGFSLIETLIALSILMIAVVGPLTLVQAGLSSSYGQRDQVIAANLAQEAIEYIKSIRDANYYTYHQDPSITNRNWLDVAGGGNLNDLCGSTDGCYVDPHGKIDGDQFVKTKVADRYLRKLEIKEGESEYFSYSYDTTKGEDTSFKRTVYISTVNVDEVVVKVLVEWDEKVNHRTYKVSTNLFNYQIGDEIVE